MKLSLHRARCCPCGAGISLPLSPASGGGTSPPLVAEQSALAAVEVWCPEMLDLVGWPDRVAGQVTCHACGLIGPTSHVVASAGGEPVGADTLAGMAEHGQREDARRDAN